MSNHPKFRLGIAMAGAVSAGAYTAGVIDYLLETLQAWQVEKDRNRAIFKSLYPEKGLTTKLTKEEIEALAQQGYKFDIPMHDVIIEVLGGASAGAMTAAVTTLALCTDTNPVTSQVEGKEPTGNLIYDAWVNLNDGEAPEDSTLIQMFGTEDLDNEENRIPSLLNSKPILRIGQKATQVLKDKGGDLKNLADYPYISENLEIIFSLCSLRGIPIQIDFEADDETDKTNDEIGNGHRMKVHKLFAHFGICDNPPDHIMPLDPTSNQHLDTLINCAVASGAFPFGLSPFQVGEKVVEQQYRGKPAKKKTGHEIPVSPKEEEPIIPSPDPKYLEAQIRRIFHPDSEKEVNHVNKTRGLKNTPAVPKNNLKMIPTIGHFETTVVDGGTINNEPFGEVLNVLERHGKEEQEAMQTFLSKENDRSNPAPDYFALLMIDPFPSDEKTEAPFEPVESIEQVLFPLFGAVRGQAMVKENEIVKGFSLKHTRGLIKPKDDQKEYPIASGSLGGFGGFFKKEFREHDFFLGRKNCQAFLRKHFFIDQEIIDHDQSYLFDSYKKCLNSLEGKEESVYQKMYDRFAFIERSEEGNYSGRVRYPIIPDMKINKASSELPEENGTAAVQIPSDLLNPQINMGDLLMLKRPLRRRIKAILFKLISKSVFKKKEEKAPHLQPERRAKLMAEGILQPDPESGCLYIYDQQRYDQELAEQKKEEQILEASVDRIINKHFKALGIFHYPLLYLAYLFLGIGLLIVIWPLLNILTEKVFKSIVSDFKKRGLLREKTS